VPITIKAGEQTQNRFGRYMHSDLIGVPYGSKVSLPTPADRPRQLQGANEAPFATVQVPASNNKGFVYVRPSRSSPFSPPLLDD
jgi:hypothetical protein